MRTDHVVLWLVTLTAACTPAKPTPSEPECTMATPLRPGAPGSPGHLIPSARNPNGASELATLMRQMADDLAAARASMKTGSQVAPLFPTHRRIRCAWPTDTSDHTPAFDGFALQYLQQVKQFDEAGSNATLRRASYQAVVAACRACHEQTCNGPLAVIDKLTLK